MNDASPILIAGGGVGGLVLALLLHQREIPCLVLESAHEVRELGVGINLLPHAVRELAALDLLPALDAVGIRTRELRYANALGQTIWSEPRGMHAGHDVPQFSIHRGRLHGLLWRAARERLGASIRTGHRVRDFADDGQGITVHLEDGSTLHGRALVGADGIHSTVRHRLHPEDGGVRWQGVQMWRGALSWPALWDGETMCIAGDEHTKLVLYPIGPGDTPGARLLNWVVYIQLADAGPRPPGHQDWSRETDVAQILPHLSRFRLPFLDAEALVRASPMHAEYPMCDRDPLAWWTRGRVTLLGDAAHPMYPVGSNGASQAILDARCLADRLAAVDTAQALRDYEQQRLPMTAAIVKANRAGGPERVIDFACRRAPEGFDDIGTVASVDELRAIVGGYAQLAGFSVQNPVSTSPRPQA